MENGNEEAFACVDLQREYLQKGLTKREYFAGLAMQGMLTQKKINEIYWQPHGYKHYFSKIAQDSIVMADTLLKHLKYPA